MFGLPRARVLHPDKQLALRQILDGKKPPKKRPAKAKSEPSLIAQMAYQVHNARQQRTGVGTHTLKGR